MNNSSPYNFTQLDQYQYTDDNCSSVIEVMNYLLVNSSGGFLEFEFDVGTVYQSIIQGFEILKNGSLKEPPMDQDFWDWAVKDDRLVDPVSEIGWINCSKQLCEAVGWQGNPDIAGVGMLATYIIQAILITVYVCGILTVNLNQRPNQSWMWPPLSRILSAVLDTTREFLSTSAMFSLALLIASICSITQDEAYSTSTTTWILLLVIPLYSVLAVSVLHLAASEILQRYKGRVLVLLIIDVMVIVLAARSSFAYNYVGYGLNWKDFDPWTYGSPCLKLTSFKKMAVVSWTVAGFLCLGITTYLIDFLISMIRKRPGILAQPSGMVRWGIIGVGLCAMWFLIGWFVKLTLDIRSRSGDNNEDNQWTFGQVLALSTWAPFLIEFGYNIWEGPKKANEVHSNYPSKSVLPDSFAMQSPGEDEERGRFALLE